MLSADAWLTVADFFNFEISSRLFVIISLRLWLFSWTRYEVRAFTSCADFFIAENFHIEPATSPNLPICQGGPAKV